jgi:hypothetical protein
VARTLIETCDPCEEFLGLEGMPAERSITIAIDGGPPKRWEVCGPHLHMLKPVLEMYERCGVDESLKRKRTPSKRDVPEPEETGTFPIPTQAPKQLEMAQTAEPEKQPARDKPSKYKKDVWVVCPLPHPQSKHGPKRVRYSTRATHAEKVHNGLRMWDIEWEDPDSVIVAKCETHAECLKTGLGFTSEVGLTQHIKASPQEKLPDDELENIA